MIRPAEKRGAEAIAAIYAPFVASTAVSFEIEAPTAEEMAKRVSSRAVDALLVARQLNACDWAVPDRNRLSTSSV